jgi:hypothetical protein
VCVFCNFHVLLLIIVMQQEEEQQLYNLSDVDEDDGSDDNITLQSMFDFYKYLVLIAGTFISGHVMSRNPSTFIQKLRWDDYINKFSNTPQFINRHLRMSLSSFYKLLELIKEGLIVNNHQANNRGGAILPEICLFCTLRWLAGGSYLDIFTFTGVSIPSFYNIVYKTMKLIINCKELQIKLPQNEAESQLVAEGFQSISFNGAIANCIGVVDGYLLRIYTPTKADAGNVKSYFSGHDQCHGINLQAVCDHHCRFIFVSVAAPGSVNDRDAIQESGLLIQLQKLPKIFVIIGDAAYPASERIVPMFYGVNRKDPQCDNFNFYASQCRIRIEMAFGLMQMKWGILWRPIRV